MIASLASVFTYTVNKDLVMPRDLYALWHATLAWAAAHYLLRTFVFTPLSVWLIKDVPPQFEKQPVDSAVDVTTTTTTQVPTTNGDLKKRAKATSVEDNETCDDDTISAKMKLVQQESARLKAIETKRAKFVIAAWRFSLYFTTSMVAFVVLSREQGAFDPSLFFKGWPEEQHMSASLKFLYQFAFGSYMYQTVDTCFVAPKQKDFVAMTVHHIVTLSLLYFSYLWGFYRIGVMVFLLHEVSDPFLELAKCFLYCGFQQVADVGFAMFAGVFIYSRVVYFPLYVISSIPLYAYHQDGQIIPYGRKDVNYSFFALLSILEVLHVYWASIIVSVAAKALFTGVKGDVRDEDEDL